MFSFTPTQRCFAPTQCFRTRMARVYDLEQLIEPALLGCDKSRISIEVRVFVEFHGHY